LGVNLSEVSSPDGSGILFLFLRKRYNGQQEIAPKKKQFKIEG
jgi:hypothetical protein